MGSNHDERMDILNALMEKRAFYLNTLEEFHTRKYTDYAVESALEDTISEIAEEISDTIWEDFEESLPIDPEDEEFDENYEAFIFGETLVHNINSYNGYGSKLLYPVPISFIEEILDELMLDFEWINYPKNGRDSWDSMINIIWDKMHIYGREE